MSSTSRLDDSHPCLPHCDERKKESMGSAGRPSSWLPAKRRSQRAHGTTWCVFSIEGIEILGRESLVAHEPDLVRPARTNTSLAIQNCAHLKQLQGSHNQARFSIFSPSLSPSCPTPAVPLQSATEFAKASLHARTLAPSLGTRGVRA